MQIVYTWLGKNYDKGDDEIVVHDSVLYAFNGSEAGPLIRWQMRLQEATVRRQNTVYGQSLLLCLHVYFYLSSKKKMYTFNFSYMI